MLLEQIKEEVAAGRVTEQTHPAYPNLSIFKYTDQCMFEDGWNPISRICRGLIMDTSTGDIIARSFPKFFNLNEMPETMVENLPNEKCEIFDKKDGSMSELYWWDNKWRVATPGSMDSPQANEAMKILEQYDLSHIPKNVTPVTEIIYEANRIVCDYGNERSLVLLAVFNRDGSEWSREEVKRLGHLCHMPVISESAQLDPTNPTFYDNQEGYVIRFASGLRVKIKSPIYVMAHRFLSNISISRVIEGVRNGTIAAVAGSCPETWRNKLDDLTGLVNTRFQNIKNDIIYHWNRLTNIPKRPEDDTKSMRKRYALWINENVPQNFRAGVFQLLDQKDISNFVWKLTEEQLTNDNPS